MQELRKNRSGSSIIISVSVTALVIASALSVSIALVASARNTASVSNANKAYFAAEAGIEQAIYNLVDTMPGEDIVVNSPAGWDATLNTTVDNKIEETFSATPTIIEIPANDSVAIPLYTGSAPNDILDLTDITLELTIHEDYIEETSEDYYRNLEPDLCINDIENGCEEENVTFLYPGLGRALDSPTINLYSDGASEEWTINDKIYQQVTSSKWCRIHESPPNSWWENIDPDDNEYCKTFTSLYPTPINNIKTDSYPHDAGDLYPSSFPLYGSGAVFYLDNDQNGLVSIANLTKLSVISASEEDAYERELSTDDYNVSSHNYLLDPSSDFVKQDDKMPYDLDGIVFQGSNVIEQPLLLINTYRIPLTLKIGLSGDAAEDAFIPAIETEISSTGQRGENSQKIDATIEQKDNIPVLNQTVVY